jgi:NTP pyrophosphatase (non-canonical NTP hydrolase)
MVASARTMLIADFQQMIRTRYEPTEEIGELAQALAERERGDGDQANLESEFADVLAWLTTLANINEVDLTRAIHAKYVDGGGPAGTK